MRRIPENPMEYIEAPKVPGKVLNIVTLEQASVLIENAACTRAMRFTVPLTAYTYINSA
jgi:hypothetical protein